MEKLRELMERRELIKKYKKLTKLHFVIGIIGISLMMFVLLYTTIIISLYRTEIRERIDTLILLWSIIAGSILFSTFIPIFVIESKQEKLLKQINTLNKTIRQDITTQIKTLENNIKEV